VTCVRHRIDRARTGHTLTMVSDSAEPTGHGTAPGSHLPGERPVGGHEHLRGRPVSRVLAGVLIAGALATVNHPWLPFWVCLGITALSGPAGKVVGIMNDTVPAGDPSPQPGREGQVAGHTGSVVNPGVAAGAMRAVSSLAAPSRRARGAHLAAPRPG
jgi:hypothetical protein